MKFYIQGKQKLEVNLTNRDFITEGGEGKIYGKDNYIYKFYSNPKKIISQDKIDELQCLKIWSGPRLGLNNILYPQALVLDKTYTPKGIVMDWAKNTVSLCKLFTNDFRKKSNILPKHILELINNMVHDIQFIHSKKCLVVDGSEINYLVR